MKLIFKLIRVTSTIDEINYLLICTITQEVKFSINSIKVKNVVGCDYTNTNIVHHIKN